MERVFTPGDLGAQRQIPGGSAWAVLREELVGKSRRDEEKPHHFPSIDQVSAILG